VRLDTPGKRREYHGCCRGLGWLWPRRELPVVPDRANIVGSLGAVALGDPGWQCNCHPNIVAEARISIAFIDCPPATSGTMPAPTTPSSCESLPETIENVEQLEELLSRPTPEVIRQHGPDRGGSDHLGRRRRDRTEPGADGSAASDAAAAETHSRVARFSSPGLQGQLESRGIDTICCELLDRDQFGNPARMCPMCLPDRHEFGSTGQEAATWAEKHLLPGLICEKLPPQSHRRLFDRQRYPLSRLSARLGRDDPPGPVVSTPMSCLGREPPVTYFSRTAATPVALIRSTTPASCVTAVLVDLAPEDHGAANRSI